MNASRIAFTVGSAAILIAGCAGSPVVEPAIAPAEPASQAGEPATLPATETPMLLPPTWTSTPSSTPKPATDTPANPEFTATIAPLQALGTFTPIPADIITPASVNQNWVGWKWIETTNTKLRVPESYEVFDLGQGMGELIVALLEGLTEGFEESFEGLEGLSGEEIQISPTEMGFTAPELEGTFDFDFLIAFDDDFITSVVLASEPTSLSLDFAMQQSLQQIEGDFRVLSRQVIEGAPYEMGRFIIEVHHPEMNRDGRQLLYIILHEGQAYSLGYQTLKSKFEAQLPVFEKSASTFTIK